MNAIISPWVFYWIGIVDNIKNMLLALLVISLFATTILSISTMCDADTYSFNDKDATHEVKVTVKVAIISFVLALLFCLIPDSDTCYKMLAADMFTQDNINSATEYVTDVIDYAVDKVKELTPTQNTEE